MADSLFDRNVNNLTVLDEVMGEATQYKRISQLFARGRHGNYRLSTFHKIFFTKIKDKLAKILIIWSFLKIREIKPSLRIKQNNLC